MTSDIIAAPKSLSDTSGCTGTWNSVMYSWSTSLGAPLASASAAVVMMMGPYSPAPVRVRVLCHRSVKTRQDPTFIHIAVAQRPWQRVMSIASQKTSGEATCRHWRAPAGPASSDTATWWRCCWSQPRARPAHAIHGGCDGSSPGVPRSIQYAGPAAYAASGCSQAAA